MKIEFTKSGTRYSADLSKPMDISIPLLPWPDQPNAFFAPPFEATPLRAGNFVGAISQGSPVNFFNIKLNPHGNGTHTECLKHIEDVDWSIRKAFHGSLMLAEVATVYPQLLENGDRVIARESLEALVQNAGEAEALILRTLPNTADKRFSRYGGNNPPFFALKAIEWIVENGFKHLLTDLPSVDPEKDDGQLLAHKAFWHKNDKLRLYKTITELVYIEDKISDGMYLLNLQILNIELDASPSRPLLYPLRTHDI